MVYFLSHPERIEYYSTIICDAMTRGDVSMNDLEIFSRMNAIQETHPLSLLTGESNQRSQQIAEHRVWLRSIRHERPNTGTRYKIGVYIRYFNQTKYEDYLAYHKKQFFDSISLCPNWELIDFYVDEGSTAPNMESAPAWSRLLRDCMDGKVDLIITQKVSNVSKSPYEITLCSRLLAAQKKPVGIYFISEDLFTLASYYRDDLLDTYFLPEPDWEVLPDSDEERRGYLNG